MLEAVKRVLGAAVSDFLSGNATWPNTMDLMSSIAARPKIVVRLRYVEHALEIFRNA
jgi:hypothetical protein